MSSKQGPHEVGMCTTANAVSRRIPDVGSTGGRSEPAEVIARLEHARALGYCARGMRRWFEGRSHTWAEFVERGVPVDWLRATGDAMAIRVAEEADKAQRAAGQHEVLVPSAAKDARSAQKEQAG